MSTNLLTSRNSACEDSYLKAPPEKEPSNRSIEGPWLLLSLCRDATESTLTTNPDQKNSWRPKAFRKSNLAFFETSAQSGEVECGAK